jgi:putative heme-binding domain-containing protein
MTSSWCNLTIPICLVVGLIVSGAGYPLGAENPVGSGSEVIAEGHQLFNKLCTSCHGIDGAAGDRGPAMAASRRYLHQSDEELFGAIQRGIPGSQMPPMGLPENDAWKIVAWIRSMRARAYSVPVAGDRDQGATIFWGKGDCGQCHVVRGRGGLLGPDLTNLGAEMSLSQIREALTVEKPHPPLGYRPLTVKTKDGRTISGVSKNEHNFSLQMMSDDNRLHLFSSDELETITYRQKSLMSTDYDKRLSETEFQNLLAFLSRLSFRDYDPNQRSRRNR